MSIPTAMRWSSAVLAAALVLGGCAGQQAEPERPTPTADEPQPAVDVPDQAPPAEPSRAPQEAVVGLLEGAALEAAMTEARADSARRPYTEADIAFMTAMIPHHAQAVVMSEWAPTHGASPAVRRLAARILAGQRDEIRMMQNWLLARGQPVPRPFAADADLPGGHGMHGAEHALMPGMLTAAQLRQLQQARGAEFDRLYLSLMIPHHQGAVTMIEELLASPRAVQDETVFRLASDINADQTVEIERMRDMLANIIFGDLPDETSTAEQP